MRVRRSFSALFAVAALLLGAGCGGNGNSVTTDETLDPLYQQAQDLEKQGRNNEALIDYLKVIDRHGENGAPESHLAAAALYMSSRRDPIEAYHHFGKFLELEPTGPRADMVRGQRDAAKREIAKMLLVPASNDQMVQLQQSDDIAQLKRHIQELEAENQTLRGGGAAVAARATPLITLPDDRTAAAASTDVPAESPITPAPDTPPAQQAFAPTIPVNGAPVAQTRPAATRPASPRAATPQRSASPGGRTHTVSPKDSLWGIARRYYGSGVTGAKVHGIYEANRDVMRSPTDLRAGMVLRIP